MSCWVSSPNLVIASRASCCAIESSRASTDAMSSSDSPPCQQAQDLELAWSHHVVHVVHVFLLVARRRSRARLARG